MKDFFTRQEEARRQSLLLLLLFAMAVMGVALAVYLACALASLWPLAISNPSIGFWQPKLFFWTTLGTLLFVSVASIWKIRELKEGGSLIAARLGGKQVSSQTLDPRERQLRNVVEEMAIASGMPVPDLFLLEKERGINAFAAGHGVHDAAICVTRGALELLSRDELQSVVAHEFSHILNGDMLLNLRLMGWLNGILVVSQAGEIMFRSMRRASGRGAAAVFGLAAILYVIGYIGYFFGQLIKSAVSRQREYLGDASAVQFTRNPEGLVMALKKIGGVAEGSRLFHPRAMEVSHMFFGNGLESAWLHALDSHPPLVDRILRLEPGFNGRFPSIKPLPIPETERFTYVPRPVKAKEGPGLSGGAVASMLSNVGEPVQEHIDLAARLISNLPAPLSAASRDPFGACALIYGLLLDRDPAIRGEQEKIVASRDSPAVGRELRMLIPDLERLEPRARMPLLDLSLPALRSLSPEQYRRLKETTFALSAADSRESLFEFTLRYHLLRHLDYHFGPVPVRPVQFYGIRGVQKECSSVLTVLSRVGHRDENEAQGAFQRGAEILQEPKALFQLLPAGQSGKGALEQAFAVLETTSPQIKRKLLAACLECIAYDRIVKVEEAELFRCIADAIGCQVPPGLGPVVARGSG